MTNPAECCRPCLACANRGETVRVAALEGHDALTARLENLGLTPGTPVRFVARAPLGGAMLFELRGYRLALRSGEAERVLVEAAS